MLILQRRLKTMWFLSLVFLAVFAAAIGSVEESFADDARKIMELVDQRDDGDSQTADMEMILIDKGGNERVRKIKMMSKDRGNDTLRMQFFTSPADVRDTAFLTYDYYGPEKDDDQWMFLPDLHKTKRIASSDKSSSFMGSDFSYADMTRRVLDEWKFRLLKEGDVEGHKVWIIEALPASEKVKKRYGYEKSIVFVRQDIYMVVRGINVLSESKKVKYMEIKELEQIDHIWVATETWMKTTKNKRTLHKTVIKSTNITFNRDCDEADFTVRRIEKGL